MMTVIPKQAKQREDASTPHHKLPQLASIDLGENPLVAHAEGVSAKRDCEKGLWESAKYGPGGALGLYRKGSKKAKKAKGPPTPSPADCLPAGRCRLSLSQSLRLSVSPSVRLHCLLVTDSV